MNIMNVISALNFKAGKVHVYSDFDGTYCPAKHASLHNEGENLFMNEYCLKMDKFFKSTEGDIHLHVTTGRTFGEYEAISHLLKIRNFRLPLPESFIAKNGSDEYIKKGTDSNFYNDGIFPYKYSEPNRIKEDKIKELTNFDGKKLKEFIRNLAIKYNLRFIEAETENSVKDYGVNSLFSEGKLNANEWEKLPMSGGKIQVHEQPIADFVMGARKDGNLKVNLIFSPDYGFCPVRNYIYDNFMNEIKEFMNSNNMKYSMNWEVPANHNYYRNHCNISPQINRTPLTKLFDTKSALIEAIKNNDMVIVAGDGSNDFEMLNPLEYIDQKDWEKYSKNSKFQEFYEADMHKKLEYIRDAYEGRNDKLKHEFDTNGFTKQIKDMPLYSIIVEKESSVLKELSNTFSRFGKIIDIEKGHLDEGIKSAIKKHAELTNEFKISMSQKLKTMLFGKIKKKDSNKMIYLGISILILSIAGLIYKITKSRSNNESTAK